MMAMVSVVHRIRRLRIAAPLMMVVVVVVVVVMVVLVVVPFVSQVDIAPIYAHLFLIRNTNY